MNGQIKVRVKFDEEKAVRFPVSFKCAGQFQTQPSYITVDCITGEIDAAYNPNVGCGWSTDERHVQRFPIPSDSHRSEIATLINDNLEFFQKVVDEGFASERSGMMKALLKRRIAKTANSIENF